MAAIKTPAVGNEPALRYHVIDAHGNHAVLKQLSVPTANAPSSAVLMLESGGNRIILSQTNATDLATALSNFGTNGVLS
jgi:hypothetical protein